MLRTLAAALVAAPLQRFGAGPQVLEASARDLVLGINAHMLRPEDRRRISELGLRHIRVPGILQLWETDEQYRAVMRDMARAASEDSLQLLWYLHNVPGGYSRPADLRDRSRWMERMSRFAAWTARLPATEAIQLWNEQDMWAQMPFGYAQGLAADTAGRLYAEQLEQAYPQIKAAGRHVLVVSGATADHPEGRWRGFLRGMLAEQPRVDAVAVHAYGPWARSRRIVLDARNLVQGQTPVWVTEFGNDQQNGERFSAARHYESITSTVEGAEREGLASRLYLYALQTDPRPEYAQHGLFEPHPRSEVAGAPRAVYAWLRARARRR